MVPPEDFAIESPAMSAPRKTPTIPVKYKDGRSTSKIL